MMKTYYMLERSVFSSIRPLILILATCFTICISAQKPFSGVSELNDISKTQESLQKKIKTINELYSTKPDTALLYIAEGLIIAEKLNDHKAIADLNAYKGDIYYKKNKLTLAYPTYSEALHLYDSLQMYKEFVELCNTQMWVLINNHDYQSAREQMNKGLDRALMINDSSLISLSYISLALVLFREKKFTEATQYLHKRLDISEKLNDEEAMIGNYFFLALVQMKLKKFNDSKKCYNKALKIAVKLDKKNEIAVLNTHLAHLYSTQNNIDLAISCIQKALKIKNEEIALVIQRKVFLGLLYGKKGENNLAQYVLNEANVMIKEFEGNYTDISALRDLGNGYLIINKPQKALPFLLQTLKLSKGNEYRMDKEYKLLSENYAALKDYEKAYVYVQKYLIIKDSLHSEQMSDKVLDLQFSYQSKIENKEKENKIVLLNQKSINDKNRFYFMIGILVLGFIGSIFLWQKNKALKKARKGALQAAKAKQDFLSNMSHEIRTPMNAIIGMTNILLDERPRKDQLDNLNVLKFSGNNLLFLINDILDFSKIEAGKIKLEKIDFTLRNLLNDILTTFNVTTTKKNIQLLLESDCDQIEHQILGDPTRLTQIFTNLISNALKFTEKGHVKVIAKVRQILNNEVRLYLAVEDTGIGIPEEKQQLIFENFTQASHTTTRIFGGTGLGLAITKKLVELHGSCVQLTSEVGKGSTFYFEWTTSLGKPISKIEKKSILSTIPKKDVLKGKRIILAEDNKINQIVARKILGKWTSHVDVANDGKEVLMLLEKNDYDLILMDIQMPNMNGYEATRAIRQMRGEKSKIVIIALTASAFASVVIEAKKIGMNDHIGKPFNPSELYDKMVKYLHKERA